MKVVLYTLVLSIFSFASFAQQEKAIAKVTKINGVPVYIFNEPLNDYEVVSAKGTGGKAGSFFTGGLVNEGISAKVAQYVKRLNKEAKKKGFEYDAVLYSEGKRATAIKFTEDFDKSKRDLAEVRSVNGTLVFAMCEPLESYDIAVEKSGGAKVGSYVTGGVVNKGIAGDLTQFVRRIKRTADDEGKEVDAIIYNSGKRAIGIKFE